MYILHAVPAHYVLCGTDSDSMNRWPYSGYLSCLSTLHIILIPALVILSLELCNNYPKSAWLDRWAWGSNVNSFLYYKHTCIHIFAAESYVGKGQYLKRLRYHGRGMSGVMYKYYAHYFLKLCEGPPPPKKKRKIEDHKSRKTKKLIEEGPRGIPNSL